MFTCANSFWCYLANWTKWYKINNMDPNQPAQKQKIVIVEDDASLADIYKTRLELLGYSCQVAGDGIAALYFIQTQHPDLVLLDLMVPDIAGDEILKRMRASKWGKDIPVYVISNLNESDAPAGLRELGIAGYSVKVGMTDDMLDQLVNKILRPAGQPQDAPPEKRDTPENWSSV